MSNKYVGAFVPMPNLVLVLSQNSPVPIAPKATLVNTLNPILLTPVKAPLLNVGLISNPVKIWLLLEADITVFSNTALAPVIDPVGVILPLIRISDDDGLFDGCEPEMRLENIVPPEVCMNKLAVVPVVKEGVAKEVAKYPVLYLF